jgi:hypothetical protein
MIYLRLFIAFVALYCGILARFNEKYLGESFIADYYLSKVYDYLFMVAKCAFSLFGDYCKILFYCLLALLDDQAL